MIVENIHKTNSATPTENQESSFGVEYIQRCLLLTFLVVSLNLFLELPLIGEASLHLGSTLVLISILTLPRRFSFLVLFASLLSLFYAGYSSIFLIIHCLEILAIALLIKQQYLLMMASIIFWLSVGMPLTYLLISLEPSYLQEVKLLVTIQTGLNGILCAALASCTLWLIPKSLLRHKYKSKERKLSSNIFAICSSIMIVPLLIVSFVFISVSSKENETLLADKLVANTTYVAQLTQSFIDERKLIVEQHAKLLSDNTPIANVKQSMLEIQEQFPAFFNITITDAQGRLIFFAPEKFNAEIARLPQALRTVADRDYFKRARDSSQTYVSNTMLSRGVVIAPMISIAAPIIKDGVFEGIVFGAINLDAIKTFEAEIETLLDDDRVLVTDEENLTVYASKSIDIKPLSIFIPLPSYNYIINQLPVLDYENHYYAYHRAKTLYGWNVYVLTETRSLNEGIRDNFVIAGLSLMIVITVFLLFAYRLSELVSAPLRELLSSEKQEPLQSTYANSAEFSDVANKLKRSQFLMQNFENRLKQQVNEKTEQLEQLNLQLAAQAREDGMTHLLNRAGFEEMAINAIKTSYRVAQPFSIAILDIDHFKTINDTYGHLFGDKCLQAFSALMQRNCKRDTDIIGRFGGEEFVIFMAGKDVLSHHQLIQNIHKQTQAIKLTPIDSEDTVSFSVSIGICSVLGNVNLSFSDIIKLADEELYKCKRAGRNKVSLVSVGYRDQDRD